MKTRTFYQLFADHGATSLLVAGRHSGLTVVQRLRDLVREGQHDLRVEFCGKNVRMAEYLSRDEKDFSKVSTYQKCHRVEVTSNTTLRVTFYQGDLMYGEPETITPSSNQLSVMAEFVITDNSGKIIPLVFPSALKQLSERLVEKERELAERHRFTYRQINVLSGLKKGRYDQDEGIEFFLNEPD
jgi:hypothetical protein